MEQRMEDIINRTVIANRLDSITGEMGLALEHSAHSPIFAEGNQRDGQRGNAAE